MATSSTVSVVIIEADGARRELAAPTGLSVMELARNIGLDVEGACEGALACSTCHVIVDPAWYERLSPPSEEEEDMLDLALGLTRTSRLGCQIILRPELNGLTLRLPAAVSNQLIG
ncbi:MAG: 2Fe-2S iron-sulfur cluster binding domain-containing protein [Alphaproteobacteria bacterium]|nr:2Fe-2S iron-sulfur cluster binding domain-containing protein [Alphaproteobacteria bacterium]